MRKKFIVTSIRGTVIKHESNWDKENQITVCGRDVY